jgi:hypothetical protein
VSFLPSLQKLAIGRYPEPFEFNLYPPKICLNIILPSKPKSSYSSLPFRFSGTLLWLPYNPSSALQFSLHSAPFWFLLITTDFHGVSLSYIHRGDTTARTSRIPSPDWPANTFRVWLAKPSSHPWTGRTVPFIYPWTGHTVPFISSSGPALAFFSDLWIFEDKGSMFFWNVGTQVELNPSLRRCQYATQTYCLYSYCIFPILLFHSGWLLLNLSTLAFRPCHHTHTEENQKAFFS